jgi:1-aminocyclopropane-1-carboxylate deaminase/D-cysteine desulfhydrase-like pyridoxal-dependent ACC family enzyme
MTTWTDQLDSLPSLGLIAGPTPLAPARRLSAALGGPLLWLKRDDLLPVAFGGNKVRALDLIVADAFRQSADTLITGAGPLSNHVRASACVAAMSGLHCVAVYWGAPPERAQGNLSLTRMLGAEIRFTGEQDRDSTDRGMASAAAEAIAHGRRPYCVPRGGACALAVLAHVLAVRETLAQCEALGIQPRVVVMAVGGAATLAGWVLGSVLFDASWRIEGVAVSRPAKEAWSRAVGFAQEAAALIGYPLDPGRLAGTIHDGFLGAGYGIPSREGQNAIATMARFEGVFLDPSYTGKAMACHLRLRSEGRYLANESVIFLHTGGTPGLF